MQSVLGLPLPLAQARLEAAGFRVLTQEVRSRKGIDAGTARVVRQRMLPDGGVELCFSVFQTELRDAQPVQ